MPTHLTLHTHPTLSPVLNSQKAHSGEKAWCRILWNLDQQNTVVKVKNKSMLSSKMNLLIVV